jgi:hypothetical protein
LTVLLIALWVRSYFAIDVIQYKYGISTELSFRIIKGQAICITKWPPGFDGGRWTITTYRVDNFPEFVNQYATVFRFGIARTDSPFGKYQVEAPLWFFVLSSVVLAGLPWLPWPRLSPRFSLRTLLIATTLVAVGLGLAVYAARK